MSIYVIYKTVNTLNGKYYIGKHKTKNINDSYLGSGSALKTAISKHGKVYSKKEILYIFQDEETAYKKEQQLVNETVVNDPKSYNMIVGGIGCPSGKLHPMYGGCGTFKGKTHSPETRKKLSNINKGRKMQYESIQKGVSIRQQRGSYTNAASHLNTEEGRSKSRERMKKSNPMFDELQKERMRLNNNNPNVKTVLVNGLTFPSLGAAARHYQTTTHLFKRDYSYVLIDSSSS